MNYISNHDGPLYRHELVTELGIDLELVTDIINELTGEDFIHDT